MKAMIVFIGVVILALFSLSFLSDMNRLTAAKYYLKDITAECAFGAAVMLREDGERAQDERVRDFMTEALASGLGRSPFLAGNAEYENAESENVGYEDPGRGNAGVSDTRGYDFTLTEGDGMLTVVVVADTEDFFRLPLFSVNRLYASISISVR